MNKKIIKMLLSAAAVIIAGIVFCISRGNSSKAPEVTDIYSRPSPEYQVQEKVGIAAESEKTVPEIWVHVNGEVKYPGVYCFSAGARTYEAIDMAGGFTENAAEEAVNLASQLSDGQYLYIPDKSGQDIQAPDMAAVNTAEQTAGSKVNINTASEDELVTLPGIGKARAEAITSWRRDHPFEAIEDIMNVSGIKENLFDKIKDLITVR